MNSPKILFFDEVNFSSLVTKKFEMKKTIFSTIFLRKKLILLENLVLPNIDTKYFIQAQ